MTRGPRFAGAFLVLVVSGPLVGGSALDSGMESAARDAFANGYGAGPPSSDQVFDELANRC